MSYSCDEEEKVIAYEMAIEEKTAIIANKDSLISALKQTNKEQLELIDRLIADLQVQDEEIKYYKDFIIDKGYNVPERN